MTPERYSSTNFDFSRSIACKSCNGVKKTCNELKKLIQDKLDVKLVDKDVAPSAINLCEAPEMRINYTYKEIGH